MNVGDFVSVLHGGGRSSRTLCMRREVVVAAVIGQLSLAVTRVLRQDYIRNDAYAQCQYKRPIIAWRYLDYRLYRAIQGTARPRATILQSNHRPRPSSIIGTSSTFSKTGYTRSGLRNISYAIRIVLATGSEYYTIPRDASDTLATRWITVIPPTVSDVH